MPPLHFFVPLFARSQVPVNVDHQGFVESENGSLFKHVAVRDREQDSAYVPSASNVAPR